MATAITYELHISLDHGRLFWLRFKRVFFCWFFYYFTKEKGKGENLKPKACGLLFVCSLVIVKRKKKKKESGFHKLKAACW